MVPYRRFIKPVGGKTNAIEVSKTVIGHFPIVDPVTGIRSLCHEPCVLPLTICFKDPTFVSTIRKPVDVFQMEIRVRHSERQR